jgi:hypothetical protein
MPADESARHGNARYSSTRSQSRPLLVAGVPLWAAYVNDAQSSTKVSGTLQAASDAADADRKLTAKVDGVESNALTVTVRK